MSRQPKPQCPDERWEEEARKWRYAAEILATICVDHIGCSYDEEKKCTSSLSCRDCWLNRAVQSLAGWKESSRG